MIKSKNHHLFSIQMQTISKDGQCLKLSVDGLKWEKIYFKI